VGDPVRVELVRTDVERGFVARRLPLHYIAGPHVPSTDAEEAAMPWTIIVILAAMWLLGMVSAYTMGGLIHVLLAAAVIVLLLDLLRGRREFS